MVTDKDGFYTMKGYERSASDEMTSSMEDYLETVSYTHLHRRVEISRRC